MRSNCLLRRPGSRSHRPKRSPSAVMTNETRGRGPPLVLTAFGQAPVQVVRAMPDRRGGLPVGLHPPGKASLVGVEHGGSTELAADSRACCSLRAVRSRTSSRSYSASEPSTSIIIRPAAVLESMPSEVNTRVTPRSVSASTVSRMYSVRSDEAVATPRGTPVSDRRSATRHTRQPMPVGCRCRAASRRRARRRWACGFGPGRSGSARSAHRGAAVRPLARCRGTRSRDSR